MKDSRMPLPVGEGLEFVCGVHVSSVASLGFLREKEEEGGSICFSF